MIKASEISCLNSAAFVMNFSIQWLTSDGKWQTSNWNSGNYPVTQMRTSPLLSSIGVPTDAIAVRPYVQAVLGRYMGGTPVVQALDSGQGVAYVVKGTTLDYSVEMAALPQSSAPTWNNWSQNLVHKPATDGINYYFSPTNQSELKSILADAVSKGLTVRVSGQRHSQPPLVADDNRNAVPSKTTQYLVDLSCYADLGDNGNQNMTLDQANLKLTVNTGVLEEDVDAFLTSNNLMMKTVTAGGFFSIGGMTAVDVHGATVQEPIFAETVSAFTIMKADGSITTIDTSLPPVNGWSPIQFARVSLGGLGIVTSVTLDVLPRPYATTLSPVRESFSLTDEASFVAKYQTLLQHTRIESFLNPYSNSFLALCWDVVENPSTQTPNQSQPVPGSCALAGLGEYGAPNQGIIEPIAEAAAEAAQAANSWGGLTGANSIMTVAFSQIETLFDAAAKANTDLWLSEAARVMFMSYFIELPNLDANGLGKVWNALNFVSQLTNQDGQFHLVGPLEFRFIHGGDAAMAGTYTTNTDSIFVNLDLIAFIEATPSSEYPAKLLQFFSQVEREWYVTYNGLPHNGKMYGFYDPSGGSPTGAFNPNFLSDLRKRRGESLEAFADFRKTMDPNGVFYNAYLQSLLES